MNSRSVVAGALFAGALALIFSPACAAAPQGASPAKPAPRTSDGHPDFNGFWREIAPASTQASKICDDDACQDPNQPVYKPQFLSEVKMIGKAQSHGINPLDPALECRPLGIPRGSTVPMQIVQGQGQLAILYAGDPVPIFRTVYLDGRVHPRELRSSYEGDSVGHWQGDTLVIDVVGLIADTWLGGGLPGTQKYTSIHSDKEHVVERWSRRGDTLNYEATVDDPVMLAKPWVVRPRQMELVEHQGTSKDELQQGRCVPHGSGKPAGR